MSTLMSPLKIHCLGYGHYFLTVKSEGESPDVWIERLSSENQFFEHREIFLKNVKCMKPTDREYRFELFTPKYAQHPNMKGLNIYAKDLNLSEVSMEGMLLLWYHMDGLKIKRELGALRLISGGVRSRRIAITTPEEGVADSSCADIGIISIGIRKKIGLSNLAVYERH